MLSTPTKYTIVAGTAEGGTGLTAFDKALLAAGIGNLNLLKVSSILPPKARFTEPLDVAPGSLLPTAFGSITCDTPGEVIAAGVAVGIASEDSYGVIMEFEGKCSREEAEKTLRGMVEEAFQVRGLPLNKILIKAVEHKVEKVGCALAAVALWY
ncbi:MAG: arginine decarboxylase, pyruvoyl-dependent [Firmicutes bacterium]|nr:arginine decarboxylase, pyruvoyl-dependent [Bacillota bacterium]